MDFIYFAFPVFALFMIAEIGIGHHREHQTYETRDTLASLAMLGGTLLINLGSYSLILGFYFWVYDFRLTTFSQSAWSWILLFFVVDLFYYGFHRASHRVRVFWAAHVNHHSSEHMNFSTALRQSWTVPLTRSLFYWPICLIGFHPLSLLTMGALSTIAAFWVHTEHIRKLWWPIEFVFVTPSHHRVHHGSNEQYLDKNYGNVLIVWDRLFGTFEPEDEPVRYGLTENIKTFNPIKIAFHEWRDMFVGVVKAKSIRESLRQVFAAPSDLAATADPGQQGNETESGEKPSEIHNAVLSKDSKKPVVPSRPIHVLPWSDHSHVESNSQVDSI